MENTENEVIGKECRYAVHIPTNSPDVPDLHLVKEIIHYKDGRIEPNIKFVKDYQVTFGVTKQMYRNHEQKKESEKIEKLNLYHSTQSKLRDTVARALGTPNSKLPLMQLSASPYLYGSDISSTVRIKHEYRKKWPELNTAFSVAVLDIETDMLHGTEDPIMITIVFKNKVYFSAVTSIFNGYSNIEARYRACVKEYIQDYIDKNNYEIDFYLAADCVDMLKYAFKKLHADMPDFVAIWNLDFDVPKMIKTFEKYGVDPAQVMCDPKIPPSMRYIHYREGSRKKVTASGKFKPKKPSEQWHSLTCPAGFMFIDQMSGYRFVRQGEQELQEYSLDFVLNAELGIRKLRFEKANAYHKARWHIFMQTNYIFEYCVYNNFDSISCMELELSKNDLSLSIPVRSWDSDFSRFDAPTKRFADKYHYYLFENHRELIGTVAPVPRNKNLSQEDQEAEYIGDFEDEFDEEYAEEVTEETDEELAEAIMVSSRDVLSIRNWILTLKSHLSVLGLPLIEDSDLLTQIRCFVYDADAKAAYPTATSTNNVSKETTLAEIIDIIGIDELEYRAQNINLLQGHVNAAEYGHVMLSLPTIHEALSMFDDLNI